MRIRIERSRTDAPHGHTARTLKTWGADAVALCLCLVFSITGGASACDSTTCTGFPQARPAAAKDSTDSGPTGKTSPARGDMPDLSFTETSLDFGIVDQGASGPLFTAVLANNSATASATNLHFESDAEFPLIHHFGSCQGLEALPPGGQCQIRLKFAPTQPGPISGLLTATSTEGAQAVMTLGGIGGKDTVLFAQLHDWETVPSFWSVISTTYVVTPAFTSEMADDFVINDPSGWTVRKIGLEVAIFRPVVEPPPIEIRFYPDAGGFPGDAPACATSPSGFTIWEPPFDESRAEIALAEPCTLPPGHYWLQVSFIQDDYWSDEKFYWGLQFVQEPVEPPPVNLHAPVWRNPGGALDHPGCIDWTPLSPPNCGLEDFAPHSTAYGSVFWLIGRTVGDVIFVSNFEPE